MPLNAAGVSVATSARIASAGSTNATLVKAGPTQAYKITVYNNAAYAVFLKLFNKATAPTVGTDVPVAVIGVPATATGASVTCDIDGLNFQLGLAYCITKLIADSDVTAVLANDLQGFLQYQ